ncbi:hypothetical protein DL96DRAFT_1631026 [Flagelloscypha sp. PMI_526]|nr:hypothetical protein DL96DRAFT_1631026 [Flagelloscypha sp. PMI_526]
MRLSIFTSCAVLFTLVAAVPVQIIKDRPILPPQRGGIDVKPPPPVVTEVVTVSGTACAEATPTPSTLQERLKDLFGGDPRNGAVRPPQRTVTKTVCAEATPDVVTVSATGTPDVITVSAITESSVFAEVTTTPLIVTSAIATQVIVASPSGTAITTTPPVTLTAVAAEPTRTRIAANV